MLVIRPPSSEYKLNLFAELSFLLVRQTEHKQAWNCKAQCAELGLEFSILNLPLFEILFLTIPEYFARYMVYVHRGLINR